MKLSDGRTLGYAEYGRPDGTPILYFHGTPSSLTTLHDYSHFSGMFPPLKEVIEFLT
jgi:pimeloyl-ACP methyl ester carboxylesterase